MGHSSNVQSRACMDHRDYHGVRSVTRDTGRAENALTMQTNSVSWVFNTGTVDPSTGIVARVNIH